MNADFEAKASIPVWLTSPEEFLAQEIGRWITVPRDRVDAMLTRGERRQVTRRMAMAWHRDHILTALELGFSVRREAIVAHGLAVPEGYRRQGEILVKVRSAKDSKPPRQRRATPFPEPKESGYQFVPGASLDPRTCAFVEPIPGGLRLRSAVSIESLPSPCGGRSVQFDDPVRGAVAMRFLFGTATADDLTPFVPRRLSLLALPVTPAAGDGMKWVSPAELLAMGLIESFDWFCCAASRWDKKRKDDDGMTLQETFDFNGKLTEQNLRAKFIVLFNKSGTNISAAMLTPRETRKIGTLPIRGFVTDNVCYRYYAATEEEAAYLVGILNSSVVNEAIKPFQPEGLLGERDIHRRPFEACAIPRFDPQDAQHRRIAEVADQARSELLSVVPKMQTPVATARADARRLVAGKLAQLDELVGRLLALQPAKYPDAQAEPLRLLELF